MQRLNMNAPQKSAGKANLSKEDIELFTNASSAEAQLSAVVGGYLTNDSLTTTPEHQVYANYGFQTTPLMASPSGKQVTMPGQNAALRAGAIQPQPSPHQYQLQQQQQFNMNYFYPQAQPLVGQPGQQQQVTAAASYYLNRIDRKSVV